MSVLVAIPIFATIKPTTPSSKTTIRRMRYTGLVRSANDKSIQGAIKPIYSKEPLGLGDYDDQDNSGVAKKLFENSIPIKKVKSDRELLQNAYHQNTNTAIHSKTHLPEYLE